MGLYVPFDLEEFSHPCSFHFVVVLVVKRPGQLSCSRSHILDLSDHFWFSPGVMWLVRLSPTFLPLGS